MLWETNSHNTINKFRCIQKQMSRLQTAYQLLASIPSAAYKQPMGRLQAAYLFLNTMELVFPY